METRDKRLHELKQMLLFRGYNNAIIDSAISRVKCIPRKVAIQYVPRNKTVQKPVLAVQYDPRLPSIQNIKGRHYRSMVSQDPYLREVFPHPPLMAFKRQKNIKDILIRAKISKNISVRPKRTQKGMKKCLKMCAACPFIKEGREIKGHNFNWKINKNVDCNTSNVVYIIQCIKENCNQKYIGETERQLKKRMSEHKGYVENKILTQATGSPFNPNLHGIFFAN